MNISLNVYTSFVVSKDLQTLLQVCSLVSAQVPWIWVWQFGFGYRGLGLEKRRIMTVGSSEDTKLIPILTIPHAESWRLCRLHIPGLSRDNVQVGRGHLCLLLVGEAFQVHLLQQDDDPTGQHAGKVNCILMVNSQIVILPPQVCRGRGWLCSHVLYCFLCVRPTRIHDLWLTGL